MPPELLITHSNCVDAIEQLFPVDDIDHVANALEQTGYCVLPTMLPDQLVDALFVHFKSLDADVFDQAGVGREQDYQVNQFVRTDEIHWLSGTHVTTRKYFQTMAQLRLAINRRLFLGLFDYECHYAFYPVGAFYRKHLDAFRGNNTRVVSTILYLNPDWKPGDGGELVLYHPDSGEVLETIAPVYGTMVFFLSEEFPHEVLPANMPRYSLTGWFRVNNSLGESIDPSR